MKEFLISFIVSLIITVCIWFITNDEWTTIIVGPIVSIWIIEILTDATI